MAHSGMNDVRCNKSNVSLKNSDGNFSVVFRNFTTLLECFTVIREFEKIGKMHGLVESQNNLEIIRFSALDGK
jgi:hypothetical protein